MYLSDAVLLLISLEPFTVQDLLALQVIWVRKIVVIVQLFVRLEAGVLDDYCFDYRFLGLHLPDPDTWL